MIKMHLLKLGKPWIKEWTTMQGKAIMVYTFEDLPYRVTGVEGRVVVLP